MNGLEARIACDISAAGPDLVVGVTKLLVEDVILVGEGEKTKVEGARSEEEALRGEVEVAV